MFDNGNGEYNTWRMHLLVPFQRQVLRILIKPSNIEGLVDKHLYHCHCIFSKKLEDAICTFSEYYTPTWNIAYMPEFWFPTQIFRFLKLHYMRWVMGENVCLVGVQHILDGASNFMCWRRMKGNLTKNEEVFNNTYSRGKIRAKSWEFGSLWPTPVIMNPGLGPNKPSLCLCFLFALFHAYCFWLKFLSSLNH